MRKWNLIAIICVLLLMGSAAYSQQVDVMFGGGGVQATKAANVSPTATNYQPQSIGGGTFLHFSGDILIHKQMGFGGEVAWRAHQALYQGLPQFPYRPILWDFNGVYAPWLGKHAAASLQAGIGAETVRFYQPTYICGFTGCTNYVSSNHFMGHFSGALRLYPKGHFFISPEIHLYLIRNNKEFSGPWATRYAMSIGYTFRSEY